MTSVLPARTRRAHIWTWRGCTDRWWSKASVFWPRRCCRGGCSGTGWGWRRSSPYWSTPPAARTPGTPETCTVGETWRVTTRASFISADWSINIVVFIPLHLSDCCRCPFLKYKKWMLNLFVWFISLCFCFFSFKNQRFLFPALTSENDVELFPHILILVVSTVLTFSWVLVTMNKVESF